VKRERFDHIAVVVFGINRVRRDENVAQDPGREHALRIGDSGEDHDLVDPVAARQSEEQVRRLASDHLAEGELPQLGGGRPASAWVQAGTAARQPVYFGGMVEKIRVTAELEDYRL